MSELVVSKKSNRLPLWVRATAVGSLGVGALVGVTGCGGHEAPAVAKTTATASGNGLPSAAESTAASTSGEAPAASSAARANCGAGTVAVNGVCEIAPTHTATHAAPRTHAPATTHAAPQPAKAEFVFDSHGSDIAKGGSNVIMVYGDPSENGRGSYQGERYMSGQSEPVDCYTEGRTVSRIPSEGETPGSSSEWYRLDTGSYATGAYGAPTETVPHC